MTLRSGRIWIQGLLPSHLRGITIATPAGDVTVHEGSADITVGMLIVLSNLGLGIFIVPFLPTTNRTIEPGGIILYPVPISKVALMEAPAPLLTIKRVSPEISFTCRAPPSLPFMARFRYL